MNKVYFTLDDIKCYGEKFRMGDRIYYGFEDWFTGFKFKNIKIWLKSQTICQCHKENGEKRGTTWIWSLLLRDFSSSNESDLF